MPEHAGCKFIAVCGCMLAYVRSMMESPSSPPHSNSRMCARTCKNRLVSCDGPGRAFVHETASYYTIATCTSPHGRGGDKDRSALVAWKERKCGQEQLVWPRAVAGCSRWSELSRADPPPTPHPLRRWSGSGKACCGVRELNSDRRRKRTRPVIVGVNQLKKFTRIFPQQKPSKFKRPCSSTSTLKN